MSWNGVLDKHEVQNFSQDQKHNPGQDVPTNNKNFQAPSNPQSYAPNNPQKDLNAPPTFQEKKLSKDDFTGFSGQNPVSEGGLGKSTQYETGLPLPQDVGSQGTGQGGLAQEGRREVSGQTTSTKAMPEGNVGI